MPVSPFLICPTMTQVMMSSSSPQPLAWSAGWVENALCTLVKVNITKGEKTWKLISPPATAVSVASIVACIFARSPFTKKPYISLSFSCSGGCIRGEPPG
jgi:hypothetical protein